MMNSTLTEYEIEENLSNVREILIEKQENLLDVEKIPIENKESLSLLKTCGMFNIVGGPLCEVFTVQIDCNSLAYRKTCEVYGEINIVDKDGFSYQIYSRNPYDIETITLQHNTLCVSPPEECFVSFTWDRMIICLKDRVDDTVIVDNSFQLGKDKDPEGKAKDSKDNSDYDKVKSDYDKVKSDYDKVKSCKVYGVGGSAIVRYSKFSAAVLADVEITLSRNDESGDTNITADLYGTVVARLGNTYGKKFPEILLFKKLPNPPYSTQSLTVINPIVLSREVVAVPVYSFLTIDVDFYDSHTNQPFVNGKADFRTYFRGSECLDIQSKDFCISVEVSWSHPDQVEQPFKVTKPFRDTKISNSNSQPVGLSILRRELSDHTYYASKLVEVFAVMIGHDGNDVLKMCGTVKVIDSLSMKHTLFKRNESRPEMLLSNMEIIPVEHPSRCYSGPEGLNIVLDLWDVQGQVLIKGDIGWSLPSLKWPISWYDRRLCSVSRGVHGYAAVFYTMFSSAGQALVNVTFNPSDFPGDKHKVYGTIVASYSNEHYASEYEKSFYRSLLFKKTRENSLELTSGGTVSLLKSAVAVPTVAALIIEVDLYVSSDRLSEVHLEGVSLFDFKHNGTISPEIKCLNYGLVLSVEWSRVFKKVSEKKSAS